MNDANKENAKSQESTESASTGSLYCLIDAYKLPNGDWESCPNCNLVPKVWSFDNGNSTGCGCGTSRYDHFSIHVESIMSYVKGNKGSALHYNFDELRENWNHWCTTGEILFEHAGKRTDGRW